MKKKWQRCFICEAIEPTKKRMVRHVFVKHCLRHPDSTSEYAYCWCRKTSYLSLSQWLGHVRACGGIRLHYHEHLLGIRAEKTP